MSRLRSIGTMGVLAFTLMSVAWAQDNSTSTSNSAPPSNGGASDAGATPQQPAPAYGQENAPPPITENPPLSGLDQPGLEPHAAPLSFIQPGVTVSESADSNAESSLGNGDSVRSISRAVGSLALQRLWRN